MDFSCLTLVSSLLCSCKVVLSAEDTYSAVVVEYSPTNDPSIDPGTNILNNVARYVEFINNANSMWLADIIVFPEIGLRGYPNQKIFLEVPDPADKVILCAQQNSKYEAPLIQLSCAARASATYVVVNLAEKFYNSTVQRTLYFNTDVVFDLHGTIIARYRKIHLFDEGGKQPSPDKALVYFDTEFGVRFGLFTCFDIIFKDPGIDLAIKYNISHFIFPTAWFSEMPFLTAIQEQWYWSYTLNAALLASGYNFPSVGSTGSGIYLGRQGPTVYNMTEDTGSFMLQANVPKQVHSSGSSTVGGRRSPGTTNRHVKAEEHVMNDISVLVSSPSKMKMKTDFFDVYKTELITVAENTNFTGKEITVPITVERTICQNALCCNFTLKITSIFNQTRQKITRGDDYSQLHYRLAVFDGIRSYDNVDTGGLQTCAIIPCVTKDLLSCGLRSDDPSAQPKVFLNLFQTHFVFESITITGNFSNNNSFIGPNVLLEGENDNFGALLLSDSFVFGESNATDTTVVKIFQTVNPIPDLVTASIYGRLFNRDGQPYTGSPKQNSSGFDLYINIVLLVIAFAMIKFSF